MKSASFFTASMFLSAVLALNAADNAERTLVSTAPIQTIAVSPDGKSIVASCADKHVRTWDVGSGKVVGDRSIGGYLMGVNLLAERSDDRKSVHIWDLAAARQMYTIDKRIAHGAVSQDGKQLAISSEAEHNLSLLDPGTGATRKVMEDGLGGAATVAFSPDGGTVVSANYDNDVRIWSTKSGELVRKVEDFTGAMFAAAFTPDGSQLVMAGLDQKIYIFDAKTYKLQRSLTGHGETILALAVAPGGRTLVTGGFDVLTVKNPVKVVFWDLASGKMQRTVRAPHAVTALAFAPDGSWLAISTAGGKEISLFTLDGTKK
jgi:WD40 repeat protein